MAKWVKLEDYEAYLSKKRNADVRVLSPKNKDFCSNCWEDFNWVIKPNYCPHCGVKMSNTEEVIPYHRNDITEELEHLKANIRFHGFYDERIEDLIDKHIEELKGERE